jgi:hypothetical protein
MSTPDHLGEHIGEDPKVDSSLAPSKLRHRRGLTSQMRQFDGACEYGTSYWVPQVSHMARSSLSKDIVEALWL